MNPLTIVFLLAVSVVFTECQVISSSCPDRMNGVDLVWAMDGSSSVGLKRYLSGLDFMKWAVLEFKGYIGDGPEQSRMALYEFDETQLVMFTLDSFKTAEEISNYIDVTMRNRDQNGTDNFFVDAIDFARTTSFAKARAGVRKVLVFVADGWTDEAPDAIAAASKRAADDKIDIFFVGYERDISEKTADIVVGPGNEGHVFIVKTFTDVAVLTGCTPLPTPPDHKFHCEHGYPICVNCPAPFFGEQCKQKISCDHKLPVVIDGVLTHKHFCHGHGDCYQEEWGPVCHCHKCWTGEWCTELKNSDQPGMEECDTTKRCILYDTEWTKTNKSAVVQHVCDLTTERCISDDIDCAFNVYVKIDKKTDRPVCEPKAPRTKCKCDYPIGYCIPLELGNKMIKSFAPIGAYVDKYFTGSS